MYPSYSQLTEQEVMFVLEPLMAFHGDGRLNIYDIECREKSAMAFQKAFKEGRIKSYTGVSRDEEEVCKIRGKKLISFLILDDKEILRDLDTLKAIGHGVVVMLGLPETSPEKAIEYKREAEKRGLKVVVYPPLKG
jgi:hypothetical protein